MIRANVQIMWEIRIKTDLKIMVYNSDLSLIEDKNTSFF